MRHPSPVPSSRRRFLQQTALVGGGLWWAGRPADAAPPVADLSVLPSGPAKPALELAHFPSRLHAFVWRNWPLVDCERMARVVGGRASDLRRLGRAMGLGGPPRITRELERRGYITILKRNWHLLPYSQLLELLGWTAEELAFTLREDDFLWVKLGGLKPVCEPLRWPPPADAATRRREREMADLVRAELGDDPAGLRGERPFQFVTDLSRPTRGGGPDRPATGNRGGAAGAGQALDGLRFCYSYFALYGDPLLDRELDPYPEGLLERLAACGVNGVWLPGLLSRLAPFPWEPERSRGHEERWRNLASLVARARRHGIRVFLYLNEPRALPRSFFAGRPALQGAGEGDYAALCTSLPEVRDYLASAVAAVARAVPDLGGFFSISASENFTHCWSHGRGGDCPRCARRPAAEVVAEVNACFHRGLREAGTGAELIVWDWGWDDAWALDAIARLPGGVAFMSVSEWGLPLERGGVKTTVGEYSLSAIGPGPRAVRHWAAARGRGLRTVAKIQAGNTWELAALPYLPVVAQVAEHAGHLRSLGLDGIMLGWTLGGYPSPNLEAVAEVMSGGTLEELARRRFGPVLGPVVVEAWTAWSRAFREFPYDASVVYSAPLQTGPANLLWPKATGFPASMVGLPYDHLDGWRGPYPAPVFAAQFERMAAGFDLATEGLRRAVRGRAPDADRRDRDAALREADLGEAAASYWRSVAAQARFVLNRDRLARGGGEEREALLLELERGVRGELDTARALHRLQVRDSRIGFEASNHYFHLPVDLAEKVLNCRWLLDVGLPRERGR